MARVKIMCTNCLPNHAGGRHTGRGGIIWRLVNHWWRYITRWSSPDDSSVMNFGNGSCMQSPYFRRAHTAHQTESLLDEYPSHFSTGKMRICLLWGGKVCIAKIGKKRFKTVENFKTFIDFKLSEHRLSACVKNFQIGTSQRRMSRVRELLWRAEWLINGTAFFH